MMSDSKNNHMKKALKPLMLVGTGSDVGKSVINAAFCRIFKQDGYTPAPFKAQNMSLNSYASSEGLEMGRAQVVQAEACGIPCKSAMNPILLKPTTDKKAQVILNGKPLGTISAKEYFLKTDRNYLFSEAMKALRSLTEEYNPIVIEGAGSISEINLWDKDITNMKVALECDAPTILIADIDRGGVFGSVFGTIKLLPEKERNLIKGILINKFRGDISLFKEGKKILEELCNVPVIGVIPYFTDIQIEQEDSVVIDYKHNQRKNKLINIAIVLLKHMSNFTDFNALERIPEINLYYTAHPNEIAKADIIIIPGSKNTISDLQWIRSQGIAKAIIQQSEQGKAIYGICGGYQMLGQEIHDPHSIESNISSIPGLGLLPITSTIGKEKHTIQTKFHFDNTSEICKGYEIHMGETQLLSGKHLCTYIDGKTEGCKLNNKLWGTYQHGIFDNKIVVRNILEANNLSAKIETIDNDKFKELQYDKLAEHIRKNIDMSYIYKILEK